MPSASFNYVPQTFLNVLKFTYLDSHMCSIFVKNCILLIHTYMHTISSYHGLLGSLFQSEGRTMENLQCDMSEVDDRGTDKTSGATKQRYQQPETDETEIHNSVT